MMIRRHPFLWITSVFVLTALTAPFAYAQDARTDIKSQLEAIEKAIEAKRTELKIAGLSLAIVKDDKVIFNKGFGLRDVERTLPVTPQTLFAVGSTTKAFTSMTVMMSADDGKLTLKDSPSKHIPYFKLRDSEANSKITIADLLSHTSGLDRVDIPWYTGKLKSHEVLSLVADIKPTAKLGEKFQYQNIMYLAAGTCVAKAQKTTWERFLSNRILKPLKMNQTNLDGKPMTDEEADVSKGYAYDATGKKHTHLPFRHIPSVAPAGVINSNSTDMAQWVRLMLGRGVFEGKRLVSEQSFSELYKKRITVAGPVGYGLGWFLREWNGYQVVEHGGNIDGFTALVAMIPDKKLGFVLLTNENTTPIAGSAMNLVWENILGKPAAPKPTPNPVPQSSDIATDKIVGTYHLEVAGLDIVVVNENGKLYAAPTGQPRAELERLAPNRYKPLPPAPPEIVVTFREKMGKPGEFELVLEQGGESYVCQRVGAKPTVSPANSTSPLKELIGAYKSDNPPITLNLEDKAGKVSLIVPGQPAYALVEKSNDVYSLGGLPDSFEVTIRRNSKGKVSGFQLKQISPQPTLEMKRVEESSTHISIKPDELMAKVVEAYGGTANLSKHKSMVTEMSAIIEHQGLKADVVTYSRQPNHEATITTLKATGKKIGAVRNYYNGKEGGVELSFGTGTKYSGDILVDTANTAAFEPISNWKTLYKSVNIKGIEKVGEEECYVVEKKPAKGNSITDYISTKTFRVMRRTTQVPLPGGGGALPVNEDFSDFRMVDGVLMPFTRTTMQPALGAVVMTVKKVKFDGKLSNKLFAPGK